MVLLKNTTVISKLNITHCDSKELFQNVNKTLGYPNIFYKASDFIKHCPEHVNFGECFVELIDKPFVFYILNFEIFLGVYFNSSKVVSDFVVFNYYNNNSDCSENFRRLEKIIFSIHCLHLKKLIMEIKDMFVAEKILNLFNFFLTKI